MYYCGTFTASTTGLRTILGLPFTPTKVRFTVNKETADVFLSAGEATSSSDQQAHTTYFDVSPQETVSSTSECLTHYERQGGVLVEVLSVAFVSFGIKRFRINTLIANPNVQIFVEAWA